MSQPYIDFQREVVKHVIKGIRSVGRSGRICGCAELRV